MVGSNPTTTTMTKDKEELQLVVFNKYYKKYSLNFLQMLVETKVIDYYNIDGNILLETKFSMN